MLNLKNCNIYNSCNLNKTQHHAYLFYSLDRALNDNIALTFAKSLICDKGDACDECASCRQFDCFSHPDVTILNSDNYKVEDVNDIILKLYSKPISANKKLFVILNFDNMNETAQNKLLKSLEEPNQYNIFILSTSKMDKILTTVLSRVNKIYLNKLSLDDKKIISALLNLDDETAAKFLSPAINLTDLFKLLNNEDENSFNSIFNLLSGLNTTADIPALVSAVTDVDKEKFLELFMDVFLSALENNKEKYGAQIVDLINSKFKKQVIINCLEKINEAYVKLKANVNFYYVLDTLLYNILKEKFLCK